MDEKTRPEKKVIPVKINHYTVVLVPEEKLTESYIQKIRNRISKAGCGSIRNLNE